MAQQTALAAAVTVAMAPFFAPAQTTAPARTTAPAVVSTNVGDPISVLKDTNASQTDRDEAARRLVLRKTPEAREVLRTALIDAGSRGSQLAAARALLLDPEPDPASVIPLFALVNGQPPLADAAIQALATYRNANDVRNRLIGMAVDRQQRESTRASAIRAVGTMSDKRAAQGLIDLVGSEAESPAIRIAAATALSDLTGAAAIRRDPIAWQRWWAGNQNKPDDEFSREMLNARSTRLTHVQQQLDQLALESNAMLTELYQSAPETNKEVVLLRYLRSGKPQTRAIGAALVQEDFKQTRPIPDSVRNQLRGMVADSSSEVRVLVAQSLFLLNDAEAFDALLAQLAREPDPDVRMALAQALVPMRDPRVIAPLLKLLRDPSLAVAESSARGLGDPNNLVPLILKDPALAATVAAELREVLDQRTGPPGTISLRAALVDAMGALKDPKLRSTYTQLLQPNETIPVRRAALRALGQFGKPNDQTWPANIIVDSLSDPNEDVRLEAVRALTTTADFSNAERLFDLVKKQSTETNDNVRAEAWTVLRILFDDPKATNGALNKWADRFRDEPERKIEILKVLSKRLAAQKDAENLATVQQNIGEALMRLSVQAAKGGDSEQTIARAAEADGYFDRALRYYRSKSPTDQDMATSALVEQRMDALLTSKQYKPAVDFAAAAIAANKGNQEAMGRKIRNDADRLRTAGNFQDAMSLIQSANQMSPRLAEPFASSIKAMEEDLRRRLENPTEQRSATGDKSEPIGNVR